MYIWWLKAKKNMIIPDQMVVVGALFNAVVHGDKNTSVSVELNGGCVPADTLTLKSVEVQNGGV